VRHFLIAFVALMAVALSAPRADAKMFRTVPNDPKNVVQFTSRATLETVVGHTSSATGHVDMNLDSVTATKDAQFDVDLNSLDTGIGMRNNDMRKSFLETDKYPSATFKLTRIISSDKPSLQPGETAHALAEGDFTVHGVTKSYQIPLTITYAKGDQSSKMRLSGGTGDILAVDGEWTVKLADHGITRPQMLFMRLAEEQHVNISIALTDVPPPEKK
jgi:polyisoprenoid-binding protein YceI